MTCNDASLWLDAALDRELELSRQLEIEEHLKSCSACSALLEEKRTLQTQVRGAALRFDVPEGLERRLRAALASEARETAEVVPPTTIPVHLFQTRGWWPGFMSAAVATSALFLLAPYAVRPALDSRLSTEVAACHVRAMMTHHTIDIQTSNQHVVKPWFNGRVDFSPDVHDFADHGFPLEGGRLDYMDHRSVAALVYHRALHPIDVFIWPSKSAQTISMQSSTHNGYHLLHWSEHGMTTWIISDLNFVELTDFAELVHHHS